MYRLFTLTDPELIDRYIKHCHNLNINIRCLMVESFFDNPHFEFIGITAQFRWCNCAVGFFVRQYKNSQAVVELLTRIFVKYDGKDASKYACSNCAAWIAR